MQYVVEVAFLSKQEWAAVLAPMVAYREAGRAWPPPADSAAGAAHAAARATHGEDADANAWPAPLSHEKLGAVERFGAPDATTLRELLDPYSRPRRNLLL